MCGRTCHLSSAVIDWIQCYSRACPCICELISTRTSNSCSAIQVLDSYIFTHLEDHLSWSRQLGYTQLIQILIVNLGESKCIVSCENHHATVLSSTHDSKDSGFVISKGWEIQKLGEWSADFYDLEVEAWGGRGEGFSGEEEGLCILQGSEDELVVDVACGVNLEIDTAIKSLERNLEYFWCYFRDCIPQGIISSY